jgi:2-polyprenyl-3-methyl-5-hydroxy-6-metoxy-1,4-benzoquinol methylase
MEKNLDYVLNLIYKDEPLYAYSLVQKIKGKKARNIQKKLEAKLDHIFNYESYLQKYAESRMDWKPMIIYHLRYEWMLNEIKENGYKSLIDLGCYEGGLLFGCAINYDMKLRGVEICKDAVNWNIKRSKRINGDIKFIQSSIEEYEDDDKYDAVVCMELIEHVPDPRAIIDKMLSLVKPNGWCYLTTPDGVYDDREGKRIWETEGFKFDHIRTFGPKKLSTLLFGCDIYLYHNDSKSIFIKFKKREI